MRVIGNELYVTGFFSSAAGIQTPGIARWDGTAWSSVGSGITISGYTGSGVTLAVTGSELYLGGGFDQAGGKPANNIALWHIPHALSIQRTASEVTLSWPATGTNFLLEACSELASSNWWPVAPAPVLANNQCVVTNALSPTDQFYRLRRR